MKTKEQIDEWLKKQDWFEKFMTNLKKLRKVSDYNQYLLYNSDGGFISRAYPWVDSSEGYKFWNNIDIKFRKWYYSKNPKDLLETGMIVEYDTGERRLVLGNPANVIVCNDYYLDFKSLKDNLISNSGSIKIDVIYEGYSEGGRESLHNILEYPGKVIWKREPEMKELTLQQIADKFNIDVKQLRIKDDE